LLSYPNYVDFRDRNDVLSGLLAFKFVTLSLSHDGENERLWGYLVSGNYFDVLGIKAFLGRTFLPEEDRTRGSHPVVVLNYSCWQRRFNSDPSIVGKDIMLNGRQFNVVGIAPEGFNGTEVIFKPEVWVPVMMEETVESGPAWLDSRNTAGLFAVGRLKAGVGLLQSQKSLGGVSRQLSEQYPDSSLGDAVMLTRPGLLVPNLRGPAIGLGSLLMILGGLVLLLACVNLATLLLARATERRKEMSIRLAMGAKRWWLMRQLLTEGLMLSLAGGVLGLLLAFWISRLVTAFKPPVDFPIIIDLRIDWRVFGFTLLVSLITGVLFALLPALQASKPDLVSALKGDSSIGGYRRSRLRNFLIATQMAFSLVLLVGGGLVLGSLQRLQHMSPGFDPEHAVEVSLDLGLQGYDAGKSREFFQELKTRIEAQPGTQAVAFANYLPLTFNRVRRGVSIEGQPPTRGGKLPSILTSHVGPDYFRAMGIPLLTGAEFTRDQIDKNAKVAIVNEAFIRRFWPGLTSPFDAVGKRFGFGNAQGVLWQVTGVARDGKYISLGENPEPFVYTPLENSDLAITLVTRSSTAPNQALAVIENEIKVMDSHLPIFDGKNLQEHLSLSLFPMRIAAAVLGSFGLLALALAAIGLYGTTSYSVAQRTHEMGIRMALGAERSDLMKLILRQGMLVASIGMVIGVLGALVLSRFMSRLLAGIAGANPAFLLGVVLVLSLVAFAACLFPARRACKVDPMSALRDL
ncbi:MAG: ABC transporter permease, partial [Pyrinomonadaceae bacterium]